jgi:hypothetical protein
MGAQLAVLHQIGLGAGKHELAAGDVHLPPPKLLAKMPF